MNSGSDEQPAGGISGAHRARHHPHCVVCSPVAEHGLRLRCSLNAEDMLVCEHVFQQTWEGYPNLVHGGILAATLDGAMTQWLLAHGQPALTAELKVRYRHPVRTGVAVTIRAELREASGPLYLLAAEIFQDGRRAVTATAKFVRNAASARLIEGPS